MCKFEVLHYFGAVTLTLFVPMGRGIFRLQTGNTGILLDSFLLELGLTALEAYNTPYSEKVSPMSKVSPSGCILSM